jgi:hypothetical protein
LESEQHFWGQIDVKHWRDTPCTTLRLATEEDVRAGRAVFYVARTTEPAGTPEDLGLPRCAMIRGDDASVSPVVVVQAEKHRSDTLIGYRSLTGGSGVCMIDDLTLLEGPDRHFYSGFDGFTLTLENHEPLLAPTLPEVLGAVDSLTPRGGPGFLVLDGVGGNYAQAAGGDGSFMVEWRQHSGRLFQHWIAGLPDQACSKQIRILTNDAFITVNENERLQAADVKTILEAFVCCKPRPSMFAWREITHELR